MQWSGRVCQWRYSVYHACESSTTHQREVALGTENEVGDKDVDVLPQENSKGDTACLMVGQYQHHRHSETVSAGQLTESKLTCETTRMIVWK